MDPHALPVLLQVWPEQGARDAQEARKLRRLALSFSCPVDPYIRRSQLRKTLANNAHNTKLVLTYGDQNDHSG